MKTIIFIALLTLLASCGKSGGGGSSSSNEHTNELQVNCNSRRNREDLLWVARSANLARKECGLTEEEAIKFIFAEM
jgi:hypothetical protein